MVPVNTSPPIENKSYVYLIAIIMFCGFFAAIFYNYMHGYYMQHTYPYMTFLWIPYQHLDDFVNVLFYVKDLNPYLGRFPETQYPFLYCVAYVLGLLPLKIALAIYVAFTLIPLYIVLYQRLRLIMLSRLETILFTIILIMTAYPVLYTLDRGNFEGILFSLVLLFWISFEIKSYWLSVVFLSMGMAMKLFPIVFLVLFFSRNKLKYVFGALGLTAVLTIIPLFLFQGGFVDNFLYLVSGNNFDNWAFLQFISPAAMVQRGANLFNFFKIILLKSGLIYSLDMAIFFKLYLVFAISIFVLIAVYALRTAQALWEKAAFLTFSMIMLPHLSSDYRLIYIFIPLIFFIVETHSNTKFAFCCAIMFALLLIPKQYMFLSGLITDSGQRDVGIGTVLNPIIIILFLFIIAISNLKKRAAIQNHP